MIFSYTYNPLLINKWGFHGGSVVKNLPANAGDKSLIHGPRRAHTQQNNLFTTTTEPVRYIAHELQQLSPRNTTTEAWAIRVCAPKQEKPLQ